LYKLFALTAFTVLLAGCSMAGPGVVAAHPPYEVGQDHETTYNSEWVNKKADPVNTLDNDRELSVDLTERELGVHYMGEDSMLGKKDTKYESAADKRRRERVEARRAVWHKRMGIKTMNEEEKERQGE
jgi:hypothetical protein